MTVGPRTRLAAVLGDPVEHSLSPAMHNAAFAAAGVDAVLLALRVAPEDLAEAVAGLRAIGAIGLSVTVPHKQAIVPLLDRIEPPADRIGAVNCVAVEPGGALVGHNTDAAGFVDGAGPVAGCRIVLLGAGGAARAVHAGLSEAGAASIAVVARAPARVDWVQARPWQADTLRGLCAGCDLLVDCTSAGLDPATEARLPAPIPLDALPAGARVATLVYHRETALVAAARRRGLATFDGRAMLLHQGARAFTLWTGRPAPLEVMRRSIDTR